MGRKFGEKDSRGLREGFSSEKGVEGCRGWNSNPLSVAFHRVRKDWKLFLLIQDYLIFLSKHETQRVEGGGETQVQEASKKISLFRKQLLSLFV